MIGIVTNAIFPYWADQYLGNSVNLAVDVAWHSPNIPPLSFYQKLVNVFETNYLSTTAVHHLKGQNAYVEKYFGPGYPDVMDLLRDVSLILLNSNDAIFGTRSFPPTVVKIGGIHITESNEIVPEV